MISRTQQEIYSVDALPSNPEPLTSSGWGLDRIDQENPTLTGQAMSYSWVNSGLGVDVYVIDSGVRLTHQDFTGRIAPDCYYDSASGFTTCNDDNGVRTCAIRTTAQLMIRF